MTNQLQSHAVKKDWRSPRWWWRVVKNSAQKLWQERNRAIGYLLGGLMLGSILWILAGLLAVVFSKPNIPFWLALTVGLVIGAVNMIRSGKQDG